MQSGKKSGLNLNSLRTKITCLTVCFAAITMIVAVVIGSVSIKAIGDESAEQILYLLCATGEKNLDSYFESVQQSVTTVSDLIESDLESTPEADLAAHVERARSYFGTAAYKTLGVLTYYYRIDPDVAADVAGFCYTNLDGKGFEEHEPTDLSQYDTTDTSQLVWFTVPKNEGHAVWQPPYITDNLDVRVVSYNVPVYRRGRFIGVVGIEIDYTTMAGAVNSIKLYDNGYAFLNDAQGNIVYHPEIDVTVMAEDERPVVPDGLLDMEALLANPNAREDFLGKQFNSVRYTYNGVEKQAVWVELSNGMRLNVTVPVSEINADWQRMILGIVLATVILLALIVTFTLRFAGRITRPLRELTEVAEQVDAGNYDVVLNCNEKDEVGVLSRTFDRLIAHLRIYISDLSSQAHTDALTAVSNKGAYNLKVRELQQRIDDPEDTPAFAIAIFDCDDLKLINDRYGHDKGDLYLKNTSALICHSFQQSSVYRIGGDEFAVILENENFFSREALARIFLQKCEETCTDGVTWWEQVRVSMGIAAYDPDDDRTVDDVARRADKLMYENKHARKANR